VNPPIVESTPAVARAYIGVGSNLGDSRTQVLAAIRALESLAETSSWRASRLYRTPPWGVLDQPPFVNAAVMLETRLQPRALLEALLLIERAAGRMRDGERWGPRILDLDLLHVEGVQLAEAGLTLPHPRIAERAFVLLPLHELAPQLAIPGQGRVDELLARMDTAGCDVLA
jgi:2-amino-4-hydroxy-6-hydroxymethyldihydropteridine diphosphokinase